LIAAAGIWLSHATGDARWDGVASVLIGILLGLIALLLAVEAKGLLIGESADPELVEELRSMAAGMAGVSGVGQVVTVHHSPDRIIAGIDVDFVDTISAGEVVAIVLRLEAAVKAQFPAVFRVFIHPASEG
jgi:divalent metal cation (Fe/Co/Zn/Cd) transporter